MNRRKEKTKIFNTLDQLIYSYFNTLDDSIDKLSNMNEIHLFNLPSWVLIKRNINIAKIKEFEIYIVKVTPNSHLEEDIIEFKEISIQEMHEFITPWPFNIDKRLFIPGNSFFSAFSDFKMNIHNNDIEELPVFEVNGMIQVGTIDKISDAYSVEEAKNDAVSIWNNAKNNFDQRMSFLENLRKIFSTFSKILNKRSFKERKIHRFINSHSNIFLKCLGLKECFFEFPLFLDTQKRVADFILERSLTFSPLLIELESTHVKVFKKDGELTAEANHAKNQINEWVQFIEENSQNTAGQMSFLAGNKERLVIMGRGLEHLNKMVSSKYSDTKIWTYDLLVIEAKKMWNEIIIDQCKLLKILDPKLLCTDPYPICRTQLR